MSVQSFPIPRLSSAVWNAAAAPPWMQIPYEVLGISMVLECTGVFLTRAKLQPYFDKGIKKVVVSAPVKDEDPVLNIVVGCNDVRAWQSGIHGRGQGRRGTVTACKQ